MFYLFFNNFYNLLLVPSDVQNQTVVDWTNPCSNFNSWL